MKLILVMFLMSISRLSFAEVPNCLKIDQIYHDICLKCDEGYVLDQMGDSCRQIELEGLNHNLANCIQISDVGECMRCDCGYSLQIELGVCMPASDLLVGCETFTGQNTCIRPKAEFMLLREDNTKHQPSLLFARGTHCEIFDLIDGSCSQCHSGYKLDRDRKCKGLVSRTVNDFYSYFSLDGELLSRSIQFIATAYGTYPKINNCDVYLIQTNSSSPLQCEKCSSGKSLNRSKNLCLKQPFDSCKTVSDTDHTLCIECTENDQFYLSTDQNQQQICLPRSDFDATTRCHQYYKLLPGCLQCAKGLISSFYGCTLFNQIQETNLFSQTQEHQLKFVASSSNQIHQLTDYGCDLWSSDGVCLFCKKQMILNNLGYCQFIFDRFCKIALATGGCFQCQNLMYYSEEAYKCVMITQSSSCQHSSGYQNKCEKCHSTFFLIQEGMCILFDDSSCKLFSGIENKCQACDNLNFLQENDTKCQLITSSLTCLHSDGITNTCLLCKQNYSLNEEGNCVIEQQIIDNYCVDKMSYLDKRTNSCYLYGFVHNSYCQFYDQYADKCLQCQNGCYLEQGYCQIIVNCLVSDGIKNECFFEHNPYITPPTEQQQLNNEDKDINNSQYQLDICAICEIDKEKIIINLSENQCLLYSQAFYQKINQRCLLYFGEMKNRSFRGQCVDIFYLRTFNNQESKLCENLLIENCMIADVKENRCVLCNEQYEMNEKTQTCELKSFIVIPFCEEMVEGICVKCRNLFFLDLYYCFAIHDPQCELSDGVRNQCQKCINGNIINQKFYYDLSLRITCAQFTIILGDRTDNNSTSALTNLHFRVSRIAMPAKLIEFLKDCERHSLLTLKCIECNEGYYVNEILSLQPDCLRIAIENCIEVITNGYKCSKCKSGYTVQDSTGLCVYNPQCLEFDKICLTCTEESLLEDGKCLQIAHCQEQKKETCLRCSSGFWLHFINGGNQDGADNYQEIGFSKDYQKDTRKVNKIENDYQKQLQADNYKTIVFEESQRITLSTTFKTECVRIPHCYYSDGIRQFCSKCDIGYHLVNQICLKNDNFQKLINCEEFAGDQTNQCAKCYNLFYINTTSCTEIQEKNCSLSDGVIDSCQLCTFEGFRLTEDGVCQKIDYCVVSNGKDWCIVCENSYIVDNLGECTKIKKTIDNCETYSYLDIKDCKCNSRSQIAQQRYQNEFFPMQNDVTDSIQLIKPFCIKCENLFWVESQGQQECFPLLYDYGGKNCELSDGITNNCLVCQQGYSLKQQLKDKTLQCTFSKKNHRLENIGCKLLNDAMNCDECFDNYFLGTNNLCYPRRGFREKCSKVHTTKDECLECRNGYKMKEIIENNIKKMVCIELQGKEIVNNCMKYAVNTNKCVKCGSRSQQTDQVEFILNEKDNICEDVINLMCRKFDASGNCQEEYIPYCQIYNENPSNYGCLKCINGGYLDESKKTCFFHDIISNCLIYSQLIKNTCETCNHLFFLEYPFKCTQRFYSALNCKIAQRDSDRCLTCENRFAVSIENGNCIENQSFQNCYSLSFNPHTNQHTCHQCKDNFYLSSDTQAQQQCLLRIIDINCKSLNISNECIECKDNYFLTYTHDCISMNSLCLLDNCLKYDNKSNSEVMLCEKCQSNYQLNSNSKKCLTLDPESNLQIQQDNLKNLEENKETQSLNGFMQIFGSILVCFSIAVLIIWGCKNILKKQKLNPTIDKISLNTINLSTTAINLEQPMKNVELSYHSQKKEQIYESL